MFSYIALIIAFTLNSLANILLKIQARHTPSAIEGLSSLVAQYGYFILAAFAFALNIVFYYIALRSLPLSSAYPVMVIMSFFIVNVYAYLALGERIGALGMLGYFFVTLGILLIVIPKHA